MRSLPGRFLLLLVLLAVVAVAVWWQHPGRETEAAPPSPEAVRTVAVFPFVGTDEESALVGRGVFHLLSHRLSGNGVWRRLAPQSLLRPAAPNVVWDIERARMRARELGAAAFVWGSVQVRGSDVTLEGKWFEVDAPVAATAAEASGALRSLPALVDRLAEQLEARRIARDEVRIARVAAVTSDSLPALLAYVRAEDGLGAGDLATAQHELEQAIEADPQFALAYLRLAEVAAWRRQDERAAQARQNALLLSNRLPVQERAFVDLLLLRLRGQGNEAASGYEAFLRSQPYEWEAWCGLADLRWEQGDAAGALQVVERVRSLLPSDADACGARARGWVHERGGS